MSSETTLTVERMMTAGADELYKAWTERFDLWFAAPGSVAMTPDVGAPFRFETEHAGARHPHYGLFLRLEPGRLVELTWVTGAGGTEGAETVVTVEFTPTDGGTLIRLTHAGFYDQKARDQHEEAWPLVLEQQDRALSAG